MRKAVIILTLFCALGFTSGSVLASPVDGNGDWPSLPRDKPIVVNGDGGAIWPAKETICILGYCLKIKK